MANAKLCDKCGAFYKFDGFYSIWSPRTCRLYDGQEKRINCLDLCPDCMEGLVKYLNVDRVVKKKEGE